MNNIWRWIHRDRRGSGLLIWAGCLLDASDRQAYRIARGAIEQRTDTSKPGSTQPSTSATASVDLALKLAGNLPSQQAEGRPGQAGHRGDRQPLEGRFRSTRRCGRCKLWTSPSNSSTPRCRRWTMPPKKRTIPQVKATLDRIYGVLLAAKEQLTQAVLDMQQ